MASGVAVVSRSKMSYGLGQISVATTPFKDTEDKLEFESFEDAFDFGFTLESSGFTIQESVDVVCGRRS